MSVITKRWFVFLAGLLVFCSQAVVAEWKVNTHKGGIMVQQQPTASDYHIFRGSVDIESNLSTLLTIIRAKGICPELVHFCKSGKVVQQINKSTRLDYVVINGPLLLDDRDIYTYSVTSYDKATKTVLVRMSGRENHDTGHPNRVRVKGFQGFWRFQEIAPGKVRVTYQTYSDPQIPGGKFLSGLMGDSTFYTLKNLRKLAKSPKYQTNAPIESFM